MAAAGGVLGEQHIAGTKDEGVAGAGLEFAVAPRWTLKAEYLYVDLGKFNCGVACGAAVTDNVTFRTNLIRAGINYRFGGPVVARY